MDEKDFVVDVTACAVIFYKLESHLHRIDSDSVQVIGHFSTVLGYSTEEIQGGVIPVCRIIGVRLHKVS